MEKEKINRRTLEEYKEELKSLTKDECYEYMYQMSEQLCNIEEYIKERKQFYEKWNNKMFDDVLKMLGNDDY